MKRNVSLSSMLCLLWAACLLGCNHPALPKCDPAPWKEEVKTQIHRLGHRNWIVVTDKAYPLQNQPGITTLYTDASYREVLAFVTKTIGQASHVYPHIYQDQELCLLPEALCPGIDSLRKEMDRLLPSGTRTFRKHDELIATLDSISRTFQVIILKTNLTMPYTSTFFELDCRYWDADKQAALEQMGFL